jgi:transposase
MEPNGNLDRVFDRNTIAARGDEAPPRSHRLERRRVEDVMARRLQDHDALRGAVGATTTRSTTVPSIPNRRAAIGYGGCGFDP